MDIKDYRVYALQELHDKQPEIIDLMMGRLIRENLSIILLSIEIYKKGAQMENQLLTIETLINEVEASANRIEEVVSALLYQPNNRDD